MSLRTTLPEPIVGPGRHTFTVICGRCSKRISMTVQNDDFRYWKAGMNVQVAFPYLNPRLHELLVKGVCADCVDAQYASEEEEPNQ
jgi:hypothetical protein